ncbi:uncharacterized protein BXZ73DRAFT_48055 [Epithele typhae]|uniref:uncharacterized protein n=1 Tax=Epithele typhae TaxID=378194 RepID=UPI00200874D3|nr:uncharacterized protein BXZ73DRAFT_48055 [Epithele typhae]KAH9929547.1 hypothetical protein BXZ73DRAFT_48055 [Epithele typhae]
MSYAAVAGRNAPPMSQQPQPDPALLTTERPSASNIADDAAKVNIVSPDFKRYTATDTSVRNVPHEGPSGTPSRRRRYIDEVEQEGFYLWNLAKQYVFHPAVAGGLIGLVNIGLVSTAAYSFYTKPHLQRDTRVIFTTVAGALGLLAAESYAAEQYYETPQGQREAQRAKQEGAVLYRQAYEQLFRSGVLGGLVGVLNAGIIGTVGYFSYSNWDKPSWDRRIVSSVTVGLLALWTGEGYIVERYRSTHHH